MRLPLELIVAIALAEICRAAFSSGPVGLLDAGGGAMAAALVLTVLMVAGVCLTTTAWLRRQVRRHPDRRAAVAGIHERAMSGEYVLATAGYAAFAAITGWPAWVMRADGLDASYLPVAGEVLQIAPFMLLCLTVWLANYPAGRVLGPADWSLGEYLRVQARGMFLLLGPWMLMCAVKGSVQYWPDRLRAMLESNPWLAVALAAAFGAALVLTFPFYLLHLWPHRRLPDGPLRTRLDALLHRAGVRCRELMVWNTGRGRVPNAAVMGLMAWSRFIVFTDALLEELGEAEVEAVLAHEIGHVRHRHIATYMLFAVVYVLGLTAVFRLLPEEIAANVWLAGLLSIALLIFCLRTVFGFLSRRLERQADLAAADLIGSPLPLMSALERLADCSGTNRTAANWRHHSIAQRVAFLSRFGFDAEARREQHAQVRLVVAMIAIVAGLLGLVNWRTGDEDASGRERQLRREIALNPHDYHRLLDLGRLLEEQERDAEAWEQYQRAAGLNAFLPDGHLGLARLCLRDERWAPKQAVSLAQEAVRRSRGRDRRREELLAALKVLAESAYRAENPALAVSALQEAQPLAGADDRLAERLEFFRRAAERLRAPPPPPEASAPGEERTRGENPQ